MDVKPILCKTTSTVVEFKQRWMIENFSLCGMKDNECKFFTGNKHECGWSLQLRHNQKNTGDYYSLQIELITSAHKDVCVDVKFGVGHDLNRVERSFSGANVKVGSKLGDECFIRKNLLLGWGYNSVYLKQDTLTIRCEGRVLFDTVSTSSQGRVPRKTTPEEYNMMIEEEWLFQQNCDY